MRTFGERAFCCDGDEEGWKAYVNGGAVLGLAGVAKLWSAEKFLFGHIENKLVFRESQPYHSQKLKLRKRFEIYMQAFRVIPKTNFLQEAKVLYLAMDKKSEAGWNSVEAMFAAFLEGGSSYYVGRSKKGGLLLAILGAARDQKGASGYAKQTVVGIMQAPVDKKGSRTQVSGSLEGKKGTGSICI